MKNTQPYILMLEHDAEDRWITSSTIQELNIDIPFKFLNYTTELFEWLDRETLPALILINYKSYPDDVFSVLKLLKGNPAHNAVPVII